jgi:hypothetical protein
MARRGVGDTVEEAVRHLAADLEVFARAEDVRKIASMLCSKYRMIA